MFFSRVSLGFIASALWLGVAICRRVPLISRGSVLRIFFLVFFCSLSPVLGCVNFVNFSEFARSSFCFSSPFLRCSLSPFPPVRGV